MITVDTKGLAFIRLVRQMSRTNASQYCETASIFKCRKLRNTDFNNIILFDIYEHTQSTKNDFNNSILFLLYSSSFLYIQNQQFVFVCVRLLKRSNILNRSTNCTETWRDYYSHMWAGLSVHRLDDSSSSNINNNTDSFHTDYSIEVLAINFANHLGRK